MDEQTVMDASAEITSRMALNSSHPCMLTWDYAPGSDKVLSLYDLAKEKTWNASTDVPWSTYARETNYPSSPASNPLNGFDAYDSLPEHERRRIAWWQHGLEISEILHGEQGALLVASQLVSCLPTVDGKLFASSQVFDEARHVEFFSRYLSDVVGRIYSPSSELKALIESTLLDSRWDMKFISCQILIESLAMAKFMHIRRTSTVPMLQFATGYILKDEARHVNFGVEILKEHLRDIGEREREMRSDFVLDNMMKLANSMNQQLRMAAALGWDTAALRFHLRKFRLENPDIIKDRFRQLAINLNSVGLLTNKIKERFGAMNLEI